MLTVGILQRLYPCQEACARERKQGHGPRLLSLTFTDLYPNQEMANRINSQEDSFLRYLLSPVNAAAIDSHIAGVRTMVCSMHHMKPEVAPKS